MLDMYVNHYNECKMKEYYQELSSVDMNALSMPDIQYITIENERCEKVVIFGIIEKVQIQEYSSFGDKITFVLRGNTWISVMQCDNKTAIYIDTQEHVLEMINIIKENEMEGMKTIRKKLEKYCRVNHMHNYAGVYVYD